LARERVEYLICKPREQGGEPGRAKLAKGFLGGFLYFRNRQWSEGKTSFEFKTAICSPWNDKFCRRQSAINFWRGKTKRRSAEGAG